MDQRWMDGEAKKTHLRRGTWVEAGGSKGKADVDTVKGPGATLQGGCGWWSPAVPSWSCRRLRCTRRAAPIKDSHEKGTSANLQEGAQITVKWSIFTWSSNTHTHTYLSTHLSRVIDSLLFFFSNIYTTTFLLSLEKNHVYCTQAWF